MISTVFDIGSFFDAGEIVIASDPQAHRTVAMIRRNSRSNIDVLTRRDGPSGSLYTLREISEHPLLWRYLAEGEDLDELSRNLEVRAAQPLTETLAGSIADVVARHSIAAMKEIEIRGTTQ